jgi:hypothetical protein
MMTNGSHHGDMSIDMNIYWIDLNTAAMKMEEAVSRLLSRRWPANCGKKCLHSASWSSGSKHLQQRQQAVKVASGWPDSLHSAPWIVVAQNGQKSSTTSYPTAASAPAHNVSSGKGGRSPVELWAAILAHRHHAVVRRDALQGRPKAEELL